MEIPVPIPTGNTVTARITGQAARHVKCEYCGCEYVYVVQATAQGSGSNPLYLNEDGAIARAKGRARYELKKQLDEIYLTIPCPDCGWYQEHMIHILKYRRFWRLALFAGAPLIWLGLEWIFTSSEDGVNLRAGLWIGLSAVLAAISIVYYFSYSDNANAASRKMPSTGGQSAIFRKAEWEKLIAAEPGKQDGTTSVKLNAHHDV